MAKLTEEFVKAKYVVLVLLGVLWVWSVAASDHQPGQLMNVVTFHDFVK